MHEEANYRGNAEPARINRLLSMPGKRLQVDIVLKDLSVDSHAAAQVAFAVRVRTFNSVSPLRPID